VRRPAPCLFAFVFALRMLVMQFNWQTGSMGHWHWDAARATENSP